MSVLFLAMFSYFVSFFLIAFRSLSFVVLFSRAFAHASAAAGLVGLFFFLDEAEEEELGSVGGGLNAGPPPRPTLPLSPPEEEVNP